jgi:hypothetical protein
MNKIMKKISINEKMEKPKNLVKIEYFGETAIKSFKVPFFKEHYAEFCEKYYQLIIDLEELYKKTDEVFDRDENDERNEFKKGYYNGVGDVLHKFLNNSLPYEIKQFKTVQDLDLQDY